MATRQGPLAKPLSLYRSARFFPFATHLAAGRSRHTESPVPALLKTWRTAPTATGSMPLPTLVSMPRSFDVKTIFRLAAAVSAMRRALPLIGWAASVVVVVDGIEPVGLVV